MIVRGLLIINDIKLSNWYIFSVNASQYILVKLVSRSVTHAGSCIAWSTVSRLTDTCRVLHPGVVMTPLTPSSARPELENTFPELCFWIWSRLSLMKSERESLDNCSTLNSSLLAR